MGEPFDAPEGVGRPERGLQQELPLQRLYQPTLPGHAELFRELTSHMGHRLDPPLHLLTPLFGLSLKSYHISREKKRKKQPFGTASQRA